MLILFTGLRIFPIKLLRRVWCFSSSVTFNHRFSASLEFVFSPLKLKTPALTVLSKNRASIRVYSERCHAFMVHAATAGSIWSRRPRFSIRWYLFPDWLSYKPLWFREWSGLLVLPSLTHLFDTRLRAFVQRPRWFTKNTAVLQSN